MNMKKVTYLAVLMVALATVFVSCEKDNGDDPIVPAGLTVADLVGDWDFVSIKVDGVEYTDPCNSILADQYTNTFMYFHDVAANGSFVLGAGCADWEGDYELVVTKNVDGKYILSFNNDNYQFEVLNASTVKTNGELKLKFIQGGDTDPDDATYTLAK
jgi:hypothetical protein